MTGAVRLRTLVAGCLAVAVASAFPLMSAPLNGIFVARLQVSGSQLSWVGDSGFLGAAAAAYLFGSLGDRIGRKRMLLVGAACVTAGEVVSGLATTVHALWVGQAIGGIGAGGLATTSLAVVVAAAATRGQRARHLAAFAGSLTAGPIVSSLLGGLTASTGTYEWAYIGMAAIAAAVGVAIAALCAESRQQPPRAIDAAGQVSLIVGLCALLWAVIEGSGTHWGRPSIIVAFVIAAVALVVFVTVERRPGGMVDLSMFRSRAFSIAAVSALVSGVIFTGLNYTYALRVTVAQGHSALFSAWGLILLAGVAGATGFASRRALAGRVGVRLLMISGFVGFAIQAFWLGAVAIDDRSFLALLGVLIIGGISQAMVTAGMSAAAVAAVRPELESVAASTQGMMRQTGQPLGIAVAGAIVFSSSQSSLAGKLSGLGLPGSVNHLAAGVNHQAGVLGVLGSGLGVKHPALGEAAVASLASGFTSGTRVLGIAAVAAAVVAFVALRGAPEVDAHTGDASADLPSPGLAATPTPTRVANP